MTTATERPTPPPKVRGLLPPLLLGIIGFSIGGLTATWLQGALWGLVAGVALIMTFRVAKLEVTAVDHTLLAAGAVLSAVLSTIVLPDLPDAVKGSLVLRFTAAWAPMALAAAAVMHRRGARPTTSINVALAWLAAAAIALPAAVSFGALVPGESLGPVEAPSFESGLFAFFGLVIAIVGLSAMLAALTRMPLLGAIAGVGLFSAFAGAQVGFTIPGLIANIRNIVNVPNFWPPDFDWAMGEEAMSRWGSVWRFAVVWAIVAIAGVLYSRLRILPPAFRILLAGVLIAVPAVVLGWWLQQWEFGPNTTGDPLIETFRIAIVAATLGCGVALPLAFLASKITAPNNPSYLGAKAFMNFIRTIPDLFWALIFVASVGIGPFAGALALFFFSLAIMAKLQSETIDAVDPGPLEAAQATGSKHVAALRSSVLPQVLPNYVAYALYIFEINIRASVVIGLVGGGGLGRVIEAQRSFFRFDRVLAVIAVIFVIVFAIEQVSVALRRRLV